MADEIAYSIGGLPPAAAVELTDLIELERPATVPENIATPLHASIAQVLAMAGSGAQTGDMLVTARDPGAGWLRQDTVYSQSAYPDLYGLVGLIPDGPPGATWNSGVNTGRAVNMYANISDTEIIGVGNNIIWRTHDGGKTWSSQTTSWNLTGVWALPSGVWAAGSNLLLHSIDGTAFVATTYRPPFATITRMVESLGRVFALGGAGVTMHYSDALGSSAWQSSGAQASNLYVVGTGVLVAALSGNNSSRSVSNGLNGSWVGGVTDGVGQYAYPSVTLSDGSVLLCHALTVKRLSAAGTQLTDVLTGVTGNGLVRVKGRIFLLTPTMNIRYTDTDGAGWTETTQVGVSLPAVMVGTTKLEIAPASGSGAIVSPFSYSYDSATQFRTPELMKTQGVIKGYIKS